MRRFIAGCLIAFFGVLANHAIGYACYFPPNRRSLIDQVLEAPIVVIGHFQNSTPPSNGSLGKSEFVFDEILVGHDSLKGRKTMVVNRESKSKEKFVVLMEFEKGKLDAYRGQELDDNGEILKFCRGALSLKDKTSIGRIRYAVESLGHPNSVVAESALVELENSKYADFRKVAESLKPEPFIAALKDAKTPLPQLGMYGRLLGHCGKKEDGALLKKVIDDANVKSNASHLENLMLGYVHLDPETGWNFLVKESETVGPTFLRRYYAFRTVRRLAGDRTDVADPKKCLEGIARFLNTPDIADFAVEDLRQRKRWEYCDTILNLPSKKDFKSNIMSQRVLRFALQCPTPAAKKFVEAERSKDAQRVGDIEEVLAEEQKEIAAPKK